MRGIDISRWQSDLDISKIDCDFVIVKATQSTDYISPAFTQQIEQAISLGKLVGIYHYAGGGGAQAEAEHFINTVKPYIGKAILCLDWEGEQNPNFKNPTYAMMWLDYVKNSTGVVPFIYMSKSVCRQYSWDASYPLWCAQYANSNTTGWQEYPWTDNKGFGAWEEPLIFQYTGSGIVDGYGGKLDLDKAYITAKEWKAYAKKATQKEPAKPKTFNVKVLCNLNVRKDAGVEYPVVAVLDNVYTVYETKKSADGGTWGRIDKGWINISPLFVQRV